MHGGQRSGSVSRESLAKAWSSLDIALFLDSTVHCDGVN